MFYTIELKIILNNVLILYFEAFKIKSKNNPQWLLYIYR